MAFTQFQLDIHRICDFLTACDSTLQPRELVVHLLLAAQIVLVAVHFHAVGIGTKTPCINTKHHVLGLRVIAINVVTITCRHQRQTLGVGELDGSFQAGFLNPHSIVHYLNEVTIIKN